MTVRLQNKGLRSIGVAKGKSIKPDAVAVVTDDTAKRLLRLYPGELIDIDNIKASFTESADLTDGQKDKPMTIAEKKAAKKLADEAEAKRLEDEEAQAELDAEEAARAKQAKEDEDARIAAENEGNK